ncbi:hypothetical protein KI387_028893 [Taxus chinensis]|uniref:DUF7815 domain-containing protein n=1 Tax=Taxus chinensis TaxID=29808 RepID=A0AA38CDQ9_TAXCH|nr:hypothetical protein KI387_028893 [Taxus chinensis]
MTGESVAPLLGKIRSHLLEVAGSSLPTSASTTPLPTLDEIVANSGSGPFRCQKCRASLLRGPNSQICAACGTEREEAAASFRISFSSTMAYQLLMASFQPQGSEVTIGNSTRQIEVSSSQTQQTEPKDGQIACDILNLVLRWPEDEARSKEHTSTTQTANLIVPSGLGVDLEDFFGQSKSHNVTDFPKDFFTSTQDIEDVKWHAPAVTIPKVGVSESHVDLFGAQPGMQQTQTPTIGVSESHVDLFGAQPEMQQTQTPTIGVSESHIDLFGAQPGMQQTQTPTIGVSGSHIDLFVAQPEMQQTQTPTIGVSERHVDLFGALPGMQQTQTPTRDDDPFGDFISANSTLDHSESKNLDTPGSSADDYPFNLIEELKVSNSTVASQSTFPGQDLFTDTVSVMEHFMPMQGNWIENDPWSAVITEEPYRGTSKNLKESSGLQSDRPDTFIVPDSQDLFVGSVWQQGDISQHNELTTGKSISHTTGESGGEELDVLFMSDPASQALKLDKETTSMNLASTEMDLFNRVESREVTDHAKPNYSSLEIDDFMVDMPKGTSNDDSQRIVEFLLSEMHDLSFMLADHLVIPDKNEENLFCL